MSWSFSSSLLDVRPRLDLLAVIAVISTMLPLMGIGIIVFNPNVAQK
jgi:hypothetical protein